jgi:hypothetical protein
MVVIVILLYRYDAGLRRMMSRGVGMRREEVRVNFARVRVVGMIGIGMDVLKRRQQKCQYDCQSGFDRDSATHRS